MKSKMAGESVSFDCQQRIYGAFDPVARKLLLVVEARNDEEAISYVGLVAPYLGLVRVSELSVVTLEAMPSGVPTFLTAFFAAGKISFNRGRVSPGSNTVQ